MIIVNRLLCCLFNIPRVRFGMQQLFLLNLYNFSYNSRFLFPYIFLSISLSLCLVSLFNPRQLVWLPLDVART